MINNETKILINPESEYVLRSFDQKLFLVPVSGKLAKIGATVELNETAAEIYKMLNENQLTLSNILEKLENKYDLIDNLQKKEIVEFVEGMLELEIITIN